MRDLYEAIDRCWEIGKAMGLDPYPIHFELVPATIMYEFGAYGLPGRFPHWTYGRAYHVMKTRYDYGLTKIYEMIINTNPSYAFLLESNSLLENTVVVAHCLGHSQTFKHNLYFRNTSKHMVEAVQASAERLAAYEQEHGRDCVERIVDAVFSIDEYVETREPKVLAKKPDQKPIGPYDDLWDLVPKTPETPLEKRARETMERQRRRDETEPDPDLLRFIARHGPELEDWERDIILTLRAESLYFQPQRWTKILNEGAASYCHTRIVRELPLSSGEFADYAAMNAGVLAHGTFQLNPYYLGLKVLEDIEKRFGKERLFSVWETESDASLLRNYLTEELIKDMDLFTYTQKRGNGATELVVSDKQWEIVRDTLVDEVSGVYDHPQIVAVSPDFKSRRSLLLRHIHVGFDLDQEWAWKTLRKVYDLWRRPVYLETIRDKGKVYLMVDKDNHNIYSESTV